MAENQKQIFQNFITWYIDINNPNYTYTDNIVIEKSIKLLLDKGIYTVNTLQKTLLKDFNLLLSKEYIIDCYCKV